MILHVPCGRFYRSEPCAPSAASHRVPTQPRGIESLAMSVSQPAVGRPVDGASRPPQPDVDGRRRVSVVGVLGEVLHHGRRGDPAVPRLAAVVERRDHGRAAVERRIAAELAVERAASARREAAGPVATAQYGRAHRRHHAYANAEAFAVMYVPRFGDDSQRTIAEGIGLDVLNSVDLGVGHYPGTQAPGEVGNFAIASHRSAYGGGMHEIEQLQLGDAIYVQTKDGWYTYRFRDLEYVTPETVERARASAAPSRAARRPTASSRSRAATRCTRPTSASSPTACSSPGNPRAAGASDRDRRRRRELGGVTMYGALWRVLPGPVWLRVILLLVLAAAVVFALFSWVFPWADAILNPINVTVEDHDPHPRHRQLRQLRLHAERLPAGARRRDRGRAQRRHRRGRCAREASPSTTPC